MPGRFGCVRSGEKGGSDGIHISLGSELIRRRNQSVLRLAGSGDHRRRANIDHNVAITQLS